MTAAILSLVPAGRIKFGFARTGSKQMAVRENFRSKNLYCPIEIVKAVELVAASGARV
jgi:hypothetical protein